MKLETILTSVKPLIGDDYSNHQVECLKKMATLANRVFLFNKQSDVDIPLPPNVFYVSSSYDPPRIKDMVGAGTHAGGVFAIVNGDIKLTDDILNVFKVTLNMGRAWAATSFRWEFNDTDEPKVEGQGLDVFVLSPRIAEAILDQIPDFLTLGRAHWDNWMNGWLRKHMKTTNYFDMTEWKCVLHKRHDRQPGRLSNYSPDQCTRLLHDVSCGGIPRQKY